MNVIANHESFFIDEEGIGHLMLNIPIYKHALMLKDLEKEKALAVDLNIAKSKRSIEQNKLMWKLLRILDKKMNGDRSDKAEEIYVYLLEKIGAKSDYIVAVERAEKDLKKSFRAVQLIKAFDEEKNIYKVYYGSSKFNTKEMTNYIEALLDYAEIVGVDTVYWKERFR